MQNPLNKKPPVALPEPQRVFIEYSVPRLKADSRLLGVAVGGSYLLDEIDEFSDLDLVVYVDPQHYHAVIAEREAIVQKMGPVLECFTGEHVGEPRLLICLFGPPLLHIDLKFVSLDDIKDKVENPIILWERDSIISSQMNQTLAAFPKPDAEWIEKRFWIWVHYTATKIGRGEIFEAVEAIGFIRANVLGPLLLQKQGARPQGLRKVEFHASPEELKKLHATVAPYDARECLQALQRSVDLYGLLRKTSKNPDLEKLVNEYINQIESQLG